MLRFWGVEIILNLFNGYCFICKCNSSLKVMAEQPSLPQACASYILRGEFYTSFTWMSSKSDCPITRARFIWAKQGSNTFRAELAKMGEFSSLVLELMNLWTSSWMGWVETSELELSSTRESCQHCIHTAPRKPRLAQPPSHTQYKPVFPEIWGMDALRFLFSFLHHY